MRIQLASALILSVLPLSSALAAESASFSLALNGLKLGKLSSKAKPTDNPEVSESYIYVDTFGLHGEEAEYPWLELGLHQGKWVAYFYPLAQGGNREVWLGMKPSEDVEVGLLFGVNSVQHSEPLTQPDGSKLKSTSTQRFGLFVNHEFEILGEGVELSVVPFVALAKSAYEQTSSDRQNQTLGASAELMWAWSPAKNLHLSSGVGYEWNQTKKKLDSKEYQTSTESDLSLTLARTELSF